MPWCLFQQCFNRWFCTTDATIFRGNVNVFYVISFSVVHDTDPPPLPPAMRDPVFGFQCISYLQVLETERQSLEHDRAELLLQKARSMLSE